MSDSLNLCLCCLEPGAEGFPIGHEQGSQRDPWRQSVQLCETCKTALLAGDFHTLAERQSDERKITRTEAAGES